MSFREIKRPKVLILSGAIDIYEKGYVANILDINEKKTFQKDKIIINQIAQTVRNDDNFFSTNNENSAFSNIKWWFDDFKIINADGELIWDGMIQDIKRDHSTKKATIISVDKLYKYQKVRVEYTSTDWETPASAVKNILDQVGFDAYDQRSIQRSIDIQADNGLYIKCFFKLSDNINVQAMLEKLGEIGASDVYMHKNKLHYAHWKPFTGGTSLNLTASDMRKNLVIETDIKELINDYSISYSGDNGVPVTDALGNNIAELSRSWYGTQTMREINGQENQQIVIRDVISAKYIGESLIRRTHYDLDGIPRPLTSVSFELPGTFKEWIDLNTFLAITLPEESYAVKIFEVFDFTIDYDNDNIKISCYEVNI